MRIALLTTEYPTEESALGSGVASYFGRVSKALASEGYDVEVFTLSNAAGTLRHESGFG